MRILAIESSCDETAAAVIDDGPRIVIWEMTRARALARTHCRPKALPATRAALESVSA